MPFTDLKIDRAFVRDACTDAECLALVTSSVELARTLQLKVVAEGIERIGEVDTLRALGCLIGQGYLYSAALPREEFIQLLDNESVPVAMPGR